MNNTGQIVGHYLVKSYPGHGFLYNGTTFITIDVGPATTPDATGTQARGINNLNEVVGLFQPPGQLPLAFIYSNGGLRPYTIPGATDIEFLGINKYGTVVGTYIDNVGKPECGFGLACGLVATPGECGE